MRVVDGDALSTAELARIDAYWRAANYLSVGQIYLMDNPLLREPLRPEHVKPRLLGHWGTTPGLNLIYAHLNRIAAARGQDLLYVTGPGHGGPGLVANVWLEGTSPRSTRRIGLDAQGMGRMFKQFSFPGGSAEPRRPGDPRLHPRGWGTRVLPLARLRRGVRQPGPGRRVRDRRRRGGDRTAGDLAGTPTSSSTRSATGRCCRSCTSTGTRSRIRRCSPGWATRN